MARLKPRERDLLWLAYAQGSSHKEIAETLGLKTASIKLLLFRARRRLAAMLRRRSEMMGAMTFNQSDCPRESEILEAVAFDRLAQVREHLDTCASCAEAAAIAGALRRDHAAGIREAQVPSAGRCGGGRRFARELKRRARCRNPSRCCRVSRERVRLG